MFQIALLCGAPGLGKTTLAHVIAQHAGYNVVEMNARCVFVGMGAVLCGSMGVVLCVFACVRVCGTWGGGGDV